MTTYSSFEDATFEDQYVALAEEQHRERSVEAEMEDRFLAQHEDDEHLPELALPF